MELGYLLSEERYLSPTRNTRRQDRAEELKIGT